MRKFPEDYQPSKKLTEMVREALEKMQKRQEECSICDDSDNGNCKLLCCKYSS